MTSNWLNDFEVMNIDLGGVVYCDLCNKDFTTDKESGGFLFESKAVCPDCASDFLAGAKKHGEEKYIRAFCPKNKSFGDFIRSFR